MRWSLFITTIITVLSIHSFLSLAAVTPSNLVELGRRGRVWAKASSKTYRKNTAKSHHDFRVGKSSVIHKTIAPSLRYAYGQKRIKDSKMHADHIFEDQIFKSHLKGKGVADFKHLPAPLQKDVRKIFNAPEHMAFIPDNINIAKGQSIKNGLAGKGHPSTDPLRDEYMKASYPESIKTAQELDQKFKSDPKHSHLAGFEDKLHDTMKTLGFKRP